MQQLDLFTYRLGRLRRQYRAHPRIYWRRLRDAMTTALKEGL